MDKKIYPRPWKDQIERARKGGRSVEPKGHREHPESVHRYKPSGEKIYPRPWKDQEPKINIDMFLKDQIETARNALVKGAWSMIPTTPEDLALEAALYMTMGPAAKAASATGKAVKGAAGRGYQALKKAGARVLNKTRKVK